MDSSPPGPRVLVLCTGNSCRSQMAEGWFRYLSGEGIKAFSAGSHPAGAVHPLAIRAMSEVGVDISGQHTKPISDFLGQSFDYVITVCDDAAEVCPVFPGKAARFHWGLEDPARAGGDEEKRMAAFREVRDLLRAHIEAFIKEIPA